MPPISLTPLRCHAAFATRCVRLRHACYMLLISATFRRRQMPRYVERVMVLLRHILFTPMLPLRWLLIRRALLTSELYDGLMLILRRATLLRHHQHTPCH